MTKLRAGLSCLAGLAMTAAASATPLRLDYCVEDLGGGTFQYTFTLTLDNHDGSWVSGQAWRWFIWGDVAYPGPSNLTGWVGDPSSLPVGPWTGYTSSGGGHNGPTFDYVLDYWTPTAVGASLTWKGTATVDLPDGQLTFSTLAGTLGGGIAPDFEVAHRLSSCGGGPPPCYANCDGSTGEPILNVNDFVCFNNRYAAGDSYANCDGSTVIPVLNVNDFVCFNNKYQAGCEHR